MSDGTKGITGNTVSSVLGADAARSSSNQVKNTKSVGKDEFLMMLVQQLKNQDPMEPMKPDEFAVNLAQFSQVEQLMNINKALESGTAGSGASLAAYLGQEVVFDSETIEIKNKDGGKVLFELAFAVPDAEIQILNVDGSVKESVKLGARNAGKHSVDLSNLETEQGEFGIKVVTQGLNGEDNEVPFHVSGTVTGFVPGADPSLLVGDREVKPNDIRQVMLGAKSQAS